MKLIYILAIIVMLVLAACITYLGLQRDQWFNPPIITGIGFLIIALLMILFIKRI